MGDALALVAGGPPLAYAVGFGVCCILLQIFVRYTRYVSILKWLTVALFAYFGVLVVAKVDWGTALRSLLLPELPLRRELHHHHRGDPRHDDQPVSVLLAGIAGGRGH